jgi:prepilin-type N-terminal cleavage/methylation domain-containing protein
MKNTQKGTSGFTLIELMIVVAIIGILAAIAIPKFAQVLRASKEGAGKGNLGSIRSALSIYYGDQEGAYPTDNLASMTTNGKYLATIPPAETPDYHANNAAVDATLPNSLAAPGDTGGWAYEATSGDANMGTVLVNCTHTDSKGTTWSRY